VICLASMSGADSTVLSSPTGGHVVNRSISGRSRWVQRTSLLRRADGGADPGSLAGRRWDVSLSFAGDDRGGGVVAYEADLGSRPFRIGQGDVRPSRRSVLKWPGCAAGAGRRLASVGSGELRDAA
jgi:hypothetical protein